MMSWAETLFQNAETWIKNLDHQRKGIVPTSDAVRFEELKSTLQCWTSLISGRSWVLQEAETWAATDGERLFFPAMLDVFTSQKLNRRAYLYLACFLVGQDENQLSELRKWRHQFQTGSLHLKEGEEFLASSLILHKFENVVACGPVANWSPDSFRSLHNLWTVRKLEKSQVKRGEDSASQDSRVQAQSTRQKKAREQIEVLQLPDNPENDNPLVHSFEKLHTTDDYKGGQKNQDGEDELKDQHESLEDLDLKQVVRSSQSTQATLKGDFVMDLEVAESQTLQDSGSSQVYEYDEWNEGKSLYHPKWCRLEERLPLATEPGTTSFDLEAVRKSKRREIENLTRRFQSLFQTPQWKNRQLEGSELDLDALTDFLSTPADKRPDKMNVYMSRRKSFNELKVIVLFDRSLSSDSWVENRRVLDVTKESLVVIGEALQKYPLPVQLACFSSQTRNRIYYDVLKNFHEPWKQGLKKLAPIEPLGYTRIGPALRHAAALLEKSKARHKWILLLSDAKPSDFDKYEGRYGVRDVRKAIQEAKSSQIGVRCLSIEKQNRFELAEMFGPRGYELLSRVDDLPHRLGVLIQNLVQIAK